MTDRSLEIAVLFTAFMLLFGFFILPTRIHERYMFPVFGVLAMMLPFSREARVPYGVLTSTHLANLAYVLPFLNAGAYISDGDPFVYAISAINLAILVYALFVMGLNLKKRTLSVQAMANEKQRQVFEGRDGER